MPTLYRRLRASYRQQWTRRWPDSPYGRETRRAVIALVLIFLLFGIVGRMDYEEELRNEAEAAARAAEIYRSYKTTLMDCAERGAHGFSLGERGYVCNITRVHP